MAVEHAMLAAVWLTDEPRGEVCAVEGSAASEEIYRGKVITLRVETVPEPIGGTRRFEIVDHAEAVAIVALREGTAGGEPEVALVRQRRPAVGRDVWEIPAGLLDANDGGVPERAASRELAEEVGYRATIWRLLTRELTSPGFTTERISIFLATGLHAVLGAEAGVPADPTEIDAVRWVPLGEALAMCRTREIEDGKTIAGLFLAREALAAHSAWDGGEMPRAAVTTAAAGTEVEVGTTHAGDEQPERNPRLTLEKMLIEEFKYARGTAAEAIEDRGRMFDRYLLLVGGLLATGVGSMFQLSQIGAGQFIQPVAIGLFFVSGVLGVAFFATLVRLRGAYRDSLVTMNVIKEYYIREFRPSVHEVDALFRWRLKTLPRHERFGSVWYLMTHVVALVGSACFGVAALVALELREPGNTGNLLPIGQAPYAAAGLVAVGAFFLHRLYFARKVNAAGIAAASAAKAEQLGI